MSKDQFKVLSQKIDRLQRTVDQVYRDVEDIFKQEQEFTLRLGGLEQKTENLEKSQRNMSNKIGDVVIEAITPIQEETSNLKDAIENTKIKVLKEKFSFKNLWHRKPKH